MRRCLSLLIIDDVEDDAALVVRAIRNAGAEVRFQRVQDQASVIAALSTQQFDAVICDFNLPTYDAFRAIEDVRRLASDIPLLVVSGSIGEDRAVELIKRGANDFVPKQHLGRVPTALERELSERTAREERRRAERAVALSEQRFRTVVGSLQDIVYTLDRDQRVDSVYGRGLQSLGLSADGMVGKTPEELVSPERAPVLRAINAEALAGKPATFDWMTDNGRSFSVALNPLHGEEGIVGAVGVARETTAQKHAEAQAMLSDRMASVGTLAAGVAHEINNPLAAVHANVSFAMRELEKGKDALGAVPDLDLNETLAALADAREASDRVRDIVRDLKLFSRSREEEVTGPVELADVVESSLRMARNEIRHRARVVNDVRRTPPVQGSESRIGQVVLNMLVNAAQAIPDGHASENEISVFTRVEGQWVVLEISDTGAGMSVETQKKIFTPFFTTKPVGVGTGLGLSICYRIVTDLGGSIEVASELGKGTRFIIRLPMAQPAELSAAPVAAPMTESKVSRRRVLVVDDEVLVGRTVQRALGRKHDVVTVQSAREALEVLKDEPFDLILCDMMMPEMNGMEFLSELERTRPELAGRVVFVTGGAFTEVGRQFLEEPGRRRLEKPFDLSALNALVEQ